MKCCLFWKKLSAIARSEELYGLLSNGGLIILLSLVWQTNTHQVLHCLGWRANSSWINISLVLTSLKSGCFPDSCLLKANVTTCPMTGQHSRNCRMRPLHHFSLPAFPALPMAESHRSALQGERIRREGTCSFLHWWEGVLVPRNKGEGCNSAVLWFTLVL